MLHIYQFNTVFWLETWCPLQHHILWYYNEELCGGQHFSQIPYNCQICNEDVEQFLRNHHLHVLGCGHYQQHSRLKSVVHCTHNCLLFCISCHRWVCFVISLLKTAISVVLMWLLQQHAWLELCLFTYVYVEKLSLTKIMYYWIVRLLGSSELERIWKGILMAGNSVVPHCSWPGEKEENNGKRQTQ
jgi:hypothetical protein